MIAPVDITLDVAVAVEFLDLARRRGELDALDCACGSALAGRPAERAEWRAILEDLERVTDLLDEAVRQAVGRRRLH